MTPQPATLPDLAFRPLTAERWSDFEELLGEHGANDGCWCMWWRLTQAQFARQLGDENRWAMKAIVDSGEIPGLIARRTALVVHSPFIRITAVCVSLHGF